VAKKTPGTDFGVKSVRVALFLLNRCWGIVMVPGLFLKCCLKKFEFSRLNPNFKGKFEFSHRDNNNNNSRLNPNFKKNWVQPAEPDFFEKPRIEPAQLKIC